MKMPLFTGTCTALVTPFLENRVNYPMMEVLLKRQIDSGIQAIVVCGTTGESATLSDEEKLEIFRRCKSFVGDRCKIIAGTGSNSTAHTVGLSIAAQEAGVDALLIVSPYYNKATPEGLIAHYLSAAHAVSIPIILYNVPSRTGLDVPVCVYKRLSNVPNIIGVKEASTDIVKTARILRECSSDFCVWSGNDDLCVPMMALGAKGIISVLSNICPIETNAMVNSALAGDFDTASALQCKLLPLIDLLFCEVNPIPVKTAMKIIGYDCGDCRLPLTTLNSVNQRKLEEYLN